MSNDDEGKILGIVNIFFRLGELEEGDIFPEKKEGEGFVFGGSKKIVILN